MKQYLTVICFFISITTFSQKLELNKLIKLFNDRNQPDKIINYLENNGYNFYSKDTGTGIDYSLIYYNYNSEKRVVRSLLLSYKNDMIVEYQYTTRYKNEYLKFKKDINTYGCKIINSAPVEDGYRRLYKWKNIYITIYERNDKDLDAQLYSIFIDSEN